MRTGMPMPRYKRPYDLTVLTLAHVLLLPAWVLLWTMIPLLILLFDGRPVLYRQLRLGKDGKEFHIIKFRTMIRDAERHVGPVRATVNDSRVTRLGRVLRMTRLDELPQVINILRGEMSIVGPRPERPELVRRFVGEIPGFERRMQVLPPALPASLTYGATPTPRRATGCATTCSTFPGLTPGWTLSSSCCLCGW